MTLDFIQILYAEEQRAELYPFARPYFSCGLTPYFENAIISGIVPTLQADLISVCSWRLRKKRGDATHYLGGVGKDALTEAQILEAFYHGADVAVLTPHSPSHQPLAMAANWHGQAWTDAYNAFKPFLSERMKVPQELKYSIYENHFIARREIYQDYVSSYLLPAISFMDQREVFFQDAGYVSKKKDSEEIQRVQRLLKAKDWPIAPFILERLFSFYIQDKGLKVINI